jgi:hypothetical protein
MSFMSKPTLSHTRLPSEDEKNEETESLVGELARASLGQDAEDYALRVMMRCGGQSTVSALLMGATPGLRMSKFIDQFGDNGLKFSICESDFTASTSFDFHGRESSDRREPASTDPADT